MLIEIASSGSGMSECSKLPPAKTGIRPEVAPATSVGQYIPLRYPCVEISLLQVDMVWTLRDGDGGWLLPRLGREGSLASKCQIMTAY